MNWKINGGAPLDVANVKAWGLGSVWPGNTGPAEITTEDDARARSHRDSRPRQQAWALIDGAWVRVNRGRGGQPKPGGPDRARKPRPHKGGSIE